MGPGFGGINLGGFALPDLDMDEINAGIAVEVAKYLADQDLSAATNEYEKDVAENTKEQITEYESGIASLPPIVEEVMQALSLPDEYKTIEAVSDRDLPVSLQPDSITELALPSVLSSTPSFAAGAYRPDYAAASGFKNPERLADKLFDRKIESLGVPPTTELDPNVSILAKTPQTTSVPVTTSLSPGAEVSPAPVAPPAPVTSTVGQYTDIQRMPDVDPNFRRIPVQSPISNLIQQQRAQYNSALQNAVYNPQPQQQQTYFRPMSAAEFGSRPGQEPSTDLGFMSMMGGGALNSGLGGLPPMQQNDKLTQLFAQSFRPRR